jgi:L-ascorbate metabolism protein UlaG (beta-lactamase superfamily)
MAALDRPATVVPVHWDSLDGELTNPPTAPNQERLNAFLAAVRKVSPRTRVVVPEYLTPYTF